MSNPKLKIRRLKKDTDEITNYSEFMKVLINDEQFDSITVFLKGPDDTPYAGYWLEFKIDTTQTNDNGQYYPFCPPDVRLVNCQVEHVNIMITSGEICLDILKNKWTPVLTLSSLFISLQSLLADPNYESAYNGNLAELYVKDQDKCTTTHYDTIRATVEKYGMTYEDVMSRFNT